MKAVIPAAGLGTRFLPATKCSPKELLPVLDKPVIQYVVEESLEPEGVDGVVIVNSHEKPQIEQYLTALRPCQMEAARSLGLTGSQAMFKVVLPQAVRNILPALGNEFVNMIKQVSLASVFFINELTTSYRTVLSATYRPIESIIIAGIIYLMLTTVLTWVMDRFEARMRRSEGTVL